MKVILETLRAHYILYLRFYLNNDVFYDEQCIFPLVLNVFTGVSHIRQSVIESKKENALLSI